VAAPFEKLGDGSVPNGRFFESGAIDTSFFLDLEKKRIPDS
jgi:hypothetical protein